MNRNETLQSVLGLEAELKKLTPGSEVHATLRTGNLEELKDAAKQMGLHVFQPFERNEEIDCYSFEYRIPRSDLTINVMHTVQFRYNKVLVEI